MKRTLIIAFIIFIVAFMAIILIAMPGCGNYTMIDTKYNFDKAYVKIGDSDWKTVEVDKWCDYEGEQIQLVLKDGTVMVINSLNCILYTGDLPKTK